MAQRYEVIRTEDSLETHLLIDHEAKARVVLAPARGGMVTRFIVGDTNVLFLDADTLRDVTKNVRGGIPVLFPIAGRLTDDKYQEAGSTYVMKQHGFARNMPWAIVDQATDGGARLGLGLAANPMTRAQYPFDFRLAITYVLSEGRLTLQMRLDTRAIPIAPVTVEVEGGPRPISAGMAGGLVIPRQKIDEVRQRARDASDILRSLHLPGLVIRQPNSGDLCVGYTAGQVRLFDDGCAPMVIFVNDVRTTNPAMALRLPPDAIERMVIYKPLEAGNLFGLGGGNGVLMIYTHGN